MYPQRMKIKTDGVFMFEDKAPGVQVPVRVGQILKETKWMKGHEEPFVHYTRIDAIVPDSGNDVLICGPGATTPEGTAIYLQIFGIVSPNGEATVDQTVPDEWGDRKVREVLPLDQLPERYIWSDAIRKDYAGLGPEQRM